MKDKPVHCPEKTDRKYLFDPQDIAQQDQQQDGCNGIPGIRKDREHAEVPF